MSNVEVLALDTSPKILYSQITLTPGGSMNAKSVLHSLSVRLTHIGFGI